jgi:hypothetical protein
MAAALKISARRLNMSPLPKSPSYGLKSGIFKPRAVSKGAARVRKAEPVSISAEYALECPATHIKRGSTVHGRTTGSGI